jgi:hypothetical protein
MVYSYVDEVQDNLLIDAKCMFLSYLMLFKQIKYFLLVLRLLCRNPHGIFMAGDTAQQITSTAFRFADLTALLYRLEVSSLHSQGDETEHGTGSRSLSSQATAPTCTSEVLHLIYQL